VTSGTQIPENPTPEELERSHEIMIFTLSNFLLTIDDPDKSWFSWQFYQDDELMILIKAGSPGSFTRMMKVMDGGQRWTMNLENL